MGATAGTRSPAAAAAAAGAAPAGRGRRDRGTERDWTRATLTELADHIERTHHAYLREMLPRLSFLTEWLAEDYGAENRKLRALRETFAAFRDEMEAHMAREERGIFPLCRRLDAPPGSPGRGLVAAAVRLVVAEHDDAGESLAAMRKLTRDFLPPVGASDAYRALLRGLGELDDDMRRHAHEENDLLFPKALAAEAVAPLAA